MMCPFRLEDRVQVIGDPTVSGKVIKMDFADKEQTIWRVWFTPADDTIFGMPGTPGVQFVMPADSLEVRE